MSVRQPEPIDQRLMVFQIASQDLVLEVIRMRSEMIALRQQLADANERLAKCEIDRKASTPSA